MVCLFVEKVAHIIFRIFSWGKEDWNYNPEICLRVRVSYDMTMKIGGFDNVTVYNFHLRS